MSMIITGVEHGIGTITMNHPGRRNALGCAMIKALIEALEQFRCERVRVVVVRAAPGMRVWCSGFDIEDLPRDGLAPDAVLDPDPLRPLIRQLTGMPMPVIGLIQGGVFGGGCELALACDLLIAEAEATFALTPGRLGVPYPIAGLDLLLNRLTATVLKEMAFSARPVTAARALALGFINHVVPAAEIEAFTLALAQDIAANAPLSLSVIKRTVAALTVPAPLSDDAAAEIHALARMAWSSRDFAEGVTAFQQRRPPQFTGE
ncbi:Methylmalonyl-CoA decarboxylase [uncultured Gammaproteobacteria bacterium]